MNCTIGHILYAYFLDEDQEHWSNYVVVTEMAINSIIDASIDKALFEVPYGENIPLHIDLLLSRESPINLRAYIFAIKI